METKQLEPKNLLALEEWRCSRCNRLLARARLPAGTIIEIKCPKCELLQSKERF